MLACVGDSPCGIPDMLPLLDVVCGVFKSSQLDARAEYLNMATKKLGFDPKAMKARVVCYVVEEKFDGHDLSACLTHYTMIHTKAKGQGIL